MHGQRAIGGRIVFWKESILKTYRTCGLVIAIALATGCGSGGTSSGAGASGGTGGATTSTGGAGGSGGSTTSTGGSGASADACNQCVFNKDVFKGGTMCGDAITACQADPDCKAFLTCESPCFSTKFTSACFADCNAAAASVTKLTDPLYACLCASCKSECAPACP